MWWNLFDYAAIAFYSPFLDEGKEQRLVATRADRPYTQNTPDAKGPRNTSHNPPRKSVNL